MIVISENISPSKEADKWYISFKIDTPTQKTVKTIDVVEVDLGIFTLATYSTGVVFEGTSAYNQLSQKLAKLQWRSRNKQLKSNNWYRE